MRSKHHTRNIQSVMSSNLSQYNLSASYQRDKVWTDEQKSGLIKSLLIGIPIPLIYLENIENDENEFEYAVVDGKQRLTTIRSFIKDEFVYVNEDFSDFDSLDGLYFSQFPKRLQKKIHNADLSFVEMWDIPVDNVDFDANDIFLLVNKGSQITATDKRRAMKSDIFEYALKLNSHPVMEILSKTKKLNNKQDFSDILLLFSEKDITSCGAIGLRNFYGEYTKGTFSSKLYDRCNEFLDFLLLHKDKVANFEKIMLRDLFILWKENKHIDSKWIDKFEKTHRNMRDKNTGIAEFVRASQRAVDACGAMETRGRMLRERI